MHRFIKAFRQRGVDRRYGAVLVTCADDFVILCRHGAAEVLETTRRWMTRIGLALNEDKTRLLGARCDAFDFLGYTFGPMYSPRTGGRYNGVRPSKEGRRVHQARHSSAPAARELDAVGGRRPRLEPHRAGLVRLLLLRHGHEGTARAPFHRRLPLRLTARALQRATEPIGMVVTFCQDKRDGRVASRPRQLTQF